MDSYLRRNDNVIQLSGIGEENEAQPGAAEAHFINSPVAGASGSLAIWINLGMVGSV